jgi:hypothetical protein
MERQISQNQKPIRKLRIGAVEIESGEEDLYDLKSEELRDTASEDTSSSQSEDLSSESISSESGDSEESSIKENWWDSG